MENLKIKIKWGKYEAINTWAVPVIRYPAGIIDWTQNELEELDQNTQKLMNMHHTLHPKSDVDRLHLPQKIGGHGLLQI